jgi:hypothetical protein
VLPLPLNPLLPDVLPLPLNPPALLPTRPLLLAEVPLLLHLRLLPLDVCKFNYIL